MSEIPQGIVAILVAADGREIANATDFHTGSPGGFEQQEAQRIRAIRRLAIKAMRELSSPLLSNAISEYDAERILRQMCDNGCKVLIVPVAYDE